MPLCPFCSEPLLGASKSADVAVISGCNSCLNPVVLFTDGGAIQARVPKGVSDIRQVAREGSIGGELLRLFPEAVQHLPVLPEMAHRVMSMVHDPEASVKALAGIIKEDQVIALKVLQLANSPVYRGLTEVKDLDAACARLGMKTIANAVLTIATGRLFKAPQRHHQETMELLWRHSLASAHCANEIGKILAEPNTDILFATGLLHDVGKVLILDLAAKSKNAALAPIVESQELFDEVMDVYHALIGLHIVRHWELPAEFAVVAYCHERIESIPDPAWMTLVHVVTLASAVAQVSGFGLAVSDDSLLGHPSTKQLGLNDIKLAVLRVDLEDRLQPLLDITAA